MRTVAMVLLAIMALASCALGQGAAAPAQEKPPIPARPAMTLQPEAIPAPCVMQLLRFLNSQFVEFLSQKIELTYDQKARVTDVLTRMEQEMKPLVAAQKKAAEDFVTMLTAPGVVIGDIQNAAQEAAKTDAAIVTQKAMALDEIRKLLSTSQNQAMDELIEKQTAPWRTLPVPAAATAPANPTDKPAK